MFGVVPKTIWNKLNPSDENNMCNWAMRCLLVETESKLILIDTGIGNKQSEKFYGHYWLNGDHSLLNSLKAAGFNKEDITDVLLTHLHFDHCGGAIERLQDNSLALTFPNAIYHLNEAHWNHANNPNPREKASFLKENFELLETSNKLNFLSENEIFANCIEIKVFNGHTIGMIAPLIHLDNGKKILYAADLYPSSAHIPANYVMAYDIQPLVTMTERKWVNDLAVKENWIFFYEHDLSVEASKIAINEKGQFYATEHGELANLLG